MAERGLWKKEIHSGSWKVLAGLPILILFAIFIVFSYDLISRLMDTAPIPKIFQGEIAKLQDYQYYIWSQWFGKNFYQIGSLLTLFFGATIVSSEVSKKTVHFLLTRPITRARVFTIKYVVSLGALMLTTVMGTAALYLLVLADGKEVSLTLMAQNTIAAAAGFSVLYSVAVLFSTIFDRSIKSVAAAGFTALLLSIPGFFPKLRGYTLFYHMQGVDIIAGRGFPLIALFVMLLATGTLYLLGRSRFAKSDY